MTFNKRTIPLAALAALAVVTLLVILARFADVPAPPHASAPDIAGEEGDVQLGPGELSRDPVRVPAQDGGQATRAVEAPAAPSAPEEPATVVVEHPATSPIQLFFVDRETGASVPGVNVRLNLQGAGTSDEHGMLRVEGIRAGERLLVRAEKEGYATYERTVLGPDPPHALRQVCELTQALALTGIVVDARGEPQLGVEVTLRQAPGVRMQRVRFENVLRHAVTDERGAFRLESSPGSGVFELVLARGELSVAGFRLELPRDDERVWRIEDPAAIEGVVERSDGVAAEMTEVSAALDAAEVWRSVRADPQGRFRIEAFPGSWTLSAAGGRASIPVEVGAGGVSGVVLYVGDELDDGEPRPKAPVELRVTDAGTGRPIEGFSLLVERVGGGSATFSGNVSSEGVFRGPLARGSYRVMVMHPAYRMVTAAIEALEGRVEPVEVEMEPKE